MQLSKTLVPGTGKSEGSNWSFLSEKLCPKEYFPKCIMETICVSSEGEKFNTCKESDAAPDTAELRGTAGLVSCNMEFPAPLVFA